MVNSMLTRQVDDREVDAVGTESKSNTVTGSSQLLVTYYADPITLNHWDQDVAKEREPMGAYKAPAQLSFFNPNWGFPVLFSHNHIITALDIQG
ncbi:hypothetical protein N7540_001608 [Penicillium herquei]|nr:hypothetical protein N7540_001608 [Penicillium herquei]